MSNPIVHAFYLGRATAEVLTETAEHLMTDALSSVGKFDAEQRERLRQFTQQVAERAEYQAAQTPSTAGAGVATNVGESDFQETIDELRAEIAQLRSTLQVYRQQSGS